MKITIEIPCEVGDILYRLFRDDSGSVEIDYVTADQILIEKDNTIIVRTRSCTGGYSVYGVGDFGRCIFVDEEVAEKRCAELNSKRGEKQRG